MAEYSIEKYATNIAMRKDDTEKKILQDSDCNIETLQQIDGHATKIKTNYISKTLGSSGQYRSEFTGRHVYRPTAIKTKRSIFIDTKHFYNFRNVSCSTVDKQAIRIGNAKKAKLVLFSSAAQYRHAGGNYFRACRMVTDTDWLLQVVGSAVYVVGIYYTKGKAKAIKVARSKADKNIALIADKAKQAQGKVDKMLSVL